VCSSDLEEKILRFVKSLPVRAIIRHHVAGDIGAE
jgi:hypothetical protein